MTPLEISRVESAGRVFQLKEPLLVSAALDDGVWVYHSPLEQDELLDGKALEMKHVLLELVAGQPVVTVA